jgi:hypothetical protein
MGNGQSSPTRSVLTSVASYVAFVGACLERKTSQLSDFVEEENRKSIVVNEAIRKRRATVSNDFNKSANMTPRTPPLSARSRQGIADREDHILLSARSIAIQKKAPLFRDTGDDEQSSIQLSARKLDMQAINEMIEKDRLRRLSAAPTPRITAST